MAVLRQVGLKGQPPILEGALPFPVQTDECLWNLADGRLLEISLAKADRMRWWPAVLQGEPEINLQKVGDVHTRSPNPYEFLSALNPGRLFPL